MKECLDINKNINDLSHYLKRPIWLKPLGKQQENKIVEIRNGKKL